jgi:hypothetical protein
MFKIPTSLPLKTASVEELTDYIEWECIKGKSISLYTALRSVYYVSDEIEIVGEDDDDKLGGQIEEISNEISRRISATEKKYPFSLSKKGYRVSIKAKDFNYEVYIYLLLSTRLNMNKHKTWSGIDGTKILEDLSAITAENYFGSRSTSMVFGTATNGNFQEKITNLVLLFGEGHSFLNRNSSNLAVQDDKLDIVVWKNFSDKKRSKLSGFGQCKTGTSWDDQVTIELQPDKFCQKWFRDGPVSTPIKLYFSSQYFPLDEYSKITNAGIVFDRFRILDYLPDTVNRALVVKIKKWNKAALLGISKIKIV